MKIAALFLFAVLCGCCNGSMASAQNIWPEAPFSERWQVGVAGSLVNPDYSNTAIPGGMVYGSYNTMRYFGVEARVHYAYKSNGEREFSLAGGYRFMVPIKRFEPFAGGLIGYGRFTDSNTADQGNGTNSFTISYLAGVDLHVTKHLNVRLFEVEAQVWTDFLPEGLNPTAYSAGVAYHR
jgi:opacity protein-like surface antigen